METNYNFDRHGSRGSLPQKRYDIYCPLMGSDPKRANYTRLSCAGRQQAKQCKNYSCRYRLKQYEPPKRRRRRSHPPKEQGE